MGLRFLGSLRASRFLLAFAGVLVLASLPARASSLLGDELQWDYYAYGALYETGNTWTDPGSGGDFQNYFAVSSDATSISFDYLGLVGGTWSSSGLSLAPTIYNGIAINLISGSPFTSVAIDPVTNMAGFNSSRISFTADQIQVDWQSLPFTLDTIVKLDVNTTSRIPEPTSVSLMAVTLGALGLWRRKRLFS